MRAASQRHCSCHWQPAGPARRRQFIALYIWILGIWPRLAAVTSRVKQSTQMGGASSTASAGANATAVPLYAQRLMRKPGMRGDLIVDPAFKLNLIATHHGQQVPAAKYDAIRRDFMQFALEDDPDALHQCMSTTSGAMSQSSTQTPTRSSTSSQSSHSSAAHTSSAPSSSSSSSSPSHLESLLAAERAEHARALAAQKQRTTDIAQQAYQRGVAEASVAHRDELRRTREAAELTHDLDLHDRELMRAAALQSTIERMKVPVTARPTLAPVACAQQRLAVQQCLRPNGANGKPVADPLACASIVRAYMECATVTVANSMVK